MKHPGEQPVLLISDSQGRISEFDELETAGMSNGHYYRPKLEEFIPMPEGSELFTLPGRLPVGIERNSGEPVLLSENPYDKDGGVRAVAAFIAPAHTTIFTSAYQTSAKAPTLPLFAYTAVGWLNDTFWVCGFRSDADIRQDANQYRQKKVETDTRKKLKRLPNNRLVHHLGKCCLTYGCPAARNFFLGRWEAPLPTSPDCNARCLGCISLQDAGCCRNPQDRITFVPSVEEISEVAIPHLQTAENPIVSFGQGCEGEPLLQGKLLEKAVIAIRRKTARGTINLNSNSSLPETVRGLADNGLDSLRVSINSVQEQYYNRYYRPKNYHFSDVLRSIDVMKDAGRFVSLNYFILPGFTDTREELAALCQVIEKNRPDFIQLRNLNMDPEWYLTSLRLPTTVEPLGIPHWLQIIKKEFPQLGLGYFNPQVNPG